MSGINATPAHGVPELPQGEPSEPMAPAVAAQPAAAMAVMPRLTGAALATRINDLGAVAIRANLVKQGVSSDAAAAEASEAAQDAQDVEDLQERIKELEDYRASLVKEQDKDGDWDDLYSSADLSWQIADVDWQIADLRSRLDGSRAALDQLANSMGDFFQNALAVLDAVVQMNKTEGQQIQATVARDREQAHVDANKAARLRDELAGRTSELRPSCEAIRREVLRAQDALKSRALEDDLQHMVDLRDLLRRLAQPGSGAA